MDGWVDELDGWMGGGRMERREGGGSGGERKDSLAEVGVFGAAVRGQLKAGERAWRPSQQQRISGHR